MSAALAVLVVVLAGIPSRADDVKAGGEWRVTFVVPTGKKSLNMIVNQHDKHLTGTVVDEYGEFPLDGRLDGNQLNVVWSVPEDGKLMEITVKGKIEGDTITGTATIGKLGEGPMTARRDPGGWASAWASKQPGAGSMSSSRNTITSPHATRIPAFRAAALPRLGCHMALSRYGAWKRSIISVVPSSEPSIATMTSYSVAVMV